MSGERAPVIADAELIDQIRDGFGVAVTSLSRVAGGADDTAVVWRAVAADGVSYAVKQSQGGMAAGLLTSAHLARRGVRGVPSPLPDRSGQPWSSRAGWQLSLTPWVAGQRVIEHGMDEPGWRSFGALLATVHAVDVPSRLAQQLPVEDYQPGAVSTVRTLDARVRDRAVGATGGGPEPDALTRGVIQAWLGAADKIAVLADRADTLGRDLRDRSASNVLCHADAHIGNLVVEDAGQVWLVDWDGAVLAPRERDLMFVLGGVLADFPISREQRSWFVDGYGRVDVEPTRLAYHLCSRAVEDIVGWTVPVLDDRGRLPRERGEALAIFGGLLSPDGIVEVALSSLRRLSSR